MSQPVHISSDVHDNVVRCVAQNRFPFPDQTDWPAEYVTITNETERQRGIEDGGSTYHPDIVIVDLRTDQVVEIGEVEVETGDHLIDKWRTFAEHSRQHPTSGSRHFFVYVPDGMESKTQLLLEQHHIPYGGVRAYTVSNIGDVAIVPIATPVDPKDHR